MTILIIAVVFAIIAGASIATLAHKTTVISTDVARNAESLRVLSGVVHDTNQRTEQQFERVDQRITRAHCEHEWSYERATIETYDHSGTYHGYVPVYERPTDSTTVYWKKCAKCHEVRIMEREEWSRAKQDALDTQYAAERDALDAEIDSINEDAKQEDTQ